MNDLEKVVGDIKTKLFSLKYDDPKIDNIRQNLTYDIVKYLNEMVEENKKQEKEKKNVIPKVTYERSNKAPIVPMRYRLLKERKK